MAEADRALTDGASYRTCKRRRFAMNIMSTSFRHGGTIPEKFSAYGDNISPSIRIEGLTPGAKSWALIMDDPDAPRGTFTHWLVYNIAPRIHELHEGEIPARAL